MIKVVFFDLGGTLIDGQRNPFPHVEAALTAITTMKTGAGRPVRSGLVSDFTMATPPVTPAKVATLFAQYLEVLDGTGLRPHFEPVAKRVTLSTHAGAMKPDRAVFDKALRRLGSSATLTDCLLITEDEGHVRFVRTQFAMAALLFRTGDHPDFTDWADAPALVADLVKAGHAASP